MSAARWAVGTWRARRDGRFQREETSRESGDYIWDQAGSDQDGAGRPRAAARSPGWGERAAARLRLRTAPGDARPGLEPLRHRARRRPRPDAAQPAPGRFD